jgi:hypothetical protein
MVSVTERAIQQLVELMENGLGYTIESQRGIIGKKKYTYKLIVDFEDDNIDGVKVNDGNI